MSITKACLLVPVLMLAGGVASAKSSGIEQSRVEAVVNDRNVALSLCYEDGRARNAKLQGNVAVSMDVDQDGHVLDAKSTAGTTLGDKDAVKCVLGVMKTLDFGSQENAQTVRYTLRFFEEPPKKED